MYIPGNRRRWLKMSQRKIKIDRTIAKDQIPAKAIAAYSKFLENQIISSAERNEEPKILIYLNWNEGRNVPEVNLVFAGSHHVEKLSYYTKNPRDWVTFGHITLSPEQGAGLAQKVKRVLELCRGVKRFSTSVELVRARETKEFGPFGVLVGEIKILGSRLYTIRKSRRHRRKI